MLLGALLALLAVLLMVAFWPTPVDRSIRGDLDGVLGWLHSIGVPAWINYTLVEFTSNILLFMPLGVLVATLSTSIPVVAATVAGLAMSLSVELGQYLLLPARAATGADVIANTAGAALGGALVWLLGRRSAGRVRRVRSRRSLSSKLGG